MELWIKLAWTYLSLLRQFFIFLLFFFLLYGNGERIETNKKKLKKEKYGSKKQSKTKKQKKTNARCPSSPTIQSVNIFYQLRVCNVKHNLIFKLFLLILKKKIISSPLDMEDVCVCVSNF